MAAKKRAKKVKKGQSTEEILRDLFDAGYNAGYKEGLRDGAIGALGVVNMTLDKEIAASKERVKAYETASYTAPPGRKPGDA